MISFFIDGLMLLCLALIRFACIVCSLDSFVTFLLISSTPSLLTILCVSLFFIHYLLLRCRPSMSLTHSLFLSLSVSLFLSLFFCLSLSHIYFSFHLPFPSPSSLHRFLSPSRSLSFFSLPSLSFSIILTNTIPSISYMKIDISYCTFTTRASVFLPVLPILYNHCLRPDYPLCP